MPLRMMVLSLTGACNLACRYCYASGQDMRMMTWGTARRAVDLAAAGGNPFILQFSGGEPLLALPLLQRIANYIRRNRIPARMDLQTNGTLLTMETAALLRRADIGIGVSLDGRPDAHDVHRCYPDGRGSSMDVIAGIQCLAQCGIEIGLTCVVTAENVGGLSGIIEMAYYLGNVRRVGFDLLRAQGRGSAVRAAREADVAQAMTEVFAACRRLEKLTGRVLSIAQEEQAACLSQRVGEGFSHCHAMSGAGVHVDPAGRIYACSSFVGDARFLLGDVVRGIDVRRQEAAAREMQDAMASCRACADFADCGGACYARRVEQENPAASDAECALKRAAMTAAGSLSAGRTARMCRHGWPSTPF
ncbi:radical SAM/SPASM domain-containing protein [uncultured Selenomonas sp.]|uniref:radical SAM/SPASM domain-containing protein n=1 Tax=uncultured Selenomonas sp. TaxID=159275 RepID=UPI0028D267F3|nr:radical SAM protein [uncultured Selenomonas sp.]